MTDTSLPASPWFIAKSGVSIDAGPVRIRMEAGGSRDQRMRIARVIAFAPRMLELLRDTAAGRFDKSTPEAAQAEAEALLALVDGGIETCICGAPAPAASPWCGDCGVGWDR